jgi:AcrR family transcriptional regulator
MLKDGVRTRMLEAAAVEFAQAGYAGAKMAAIAKRAGVSTGNLYRYFANRDALFYTLITDEFAASLLEVLGRRVASLTRADVLTALGESAQGDGESLLAFWIEHRLQVVALLDGAQGSRFAGFRSRFVEALMAPTLATLGDGRPVVEQTLRRIFENTTGTIVSVLRSHEDAVAMREAFAAFWSFQLAGLEGFRTWVNTTN